MDAMRIRIKTQHPAIILTALTHTALATLAWWASANSLFQGAGERALLQAALPITGVLNLAACLPAQSGRTILEICRVMPAIAGTAAVALYAGTSRSPAGIAPELLAALAAGPAICLAGITLGYMRSRGR